MGLRQRIRQWWHDRLPLTDQWQLSQRNVYIVPTKAGFVFTVTLLVMLLASINYQLNLGYVLTFLLAGCGLVSMHLTHNNLRGLSLRLRPGSATFAGEPAPIDVVVDNPGRARFALSLHFDDRDTHGASFAWCDVGAGDQAVVRVSLVPARRGWHAVPTMRMETVFPFGLFRAWTLWRPAARVLAYPRPEQPAPPLPPAQPVPGERPLPHGHAGSELDGVRPWRRGDSMRQVAWKKVARSGELISRETSATGSRDLRLDWQSAAGAGRDVEQRLSRLAAWVLAAERAGLVWALSLPGFEQASGYGDAQRRAALEALAQWS